MKPSISKIKHEFAKLKKTLARLFYGIEAIFILFLVIVIFFGVYGAYNEKDSIINYLPDNLTGLIHYTPSKGGAVFNSLFLNEAKKYFQSDEIFFDNFKEAAIIFLENKGTSYPLLIFAPKNAEDLELGWAHQTTRVILRTPSRIIAGRGTKDPLNQRLASGDSSPRHDTKIFGVMARSSAQNDAHIELLKNNGNLINEVWNEKFIVMAEEPEILKLLSQGAFKYKRTLKLFKEKNGFNTVVYLNLEKIKKTSNSLDKAILNALKTKKLNEFFIGLKEDGKDNLINIADISGLEIVAVKVSSSNSASPNLIAAACADFPDNASFILPAETFSKPNNAIAEILPAGKIKIIFLKKFRQNSLPPACAMPPVGALPPACAGRAQAGGQAFPEISQSYFHNQLMLNGEKSPFHYILAMGKNEKNEKVIENLKTAAINYLDEIMPEEKTVTLPDGTFMTELWSNPLRLKFKPAQIIAENGESIAPPLRGDTPLDPPSRGGRGVLNDDNSAILWDLSIPALDFEFAYAKTPDCILLSNSTAALSDYLLPSEKSLLNCDNTMPLPVETGHCPVSTMKNQGEDENFYINIDYLKSKSDIFKILSEFGNYAEGIIEE